jgi:hypothetical protein
VYVYCYSVAITPGGNLNFLQTVQNSIDLCSHDVSVKTFLLHHVMLIEYFAFARAGAIAPTANTMIILLQSSDMHGLLKSKVSFRWRTSYGSIGRFGGLERQSPQFFLDIMKTASKRSAAPQIYKPNSAYVWKLTNLPSEVNIFQYAISYCKLYDFSVDDSSILILLREM